MSAEARGVVHIDNARSLERDAVVAKDSDDLLAARQLDPRHCAAIAQGDGHGLDAVVRLGEASGLVGEVLGQAAFRSHVTDGIAGYQLDRR